jgi:hypothetical protein
LQHRTRQIQIQNIKRLDGSQSYDWSTYPPNIASVMPTQKLLPTTVPLLLQSCTRCQRNVYKLLSSNGHPFWLEQTCHYTNNTCVRARLVKIRCYTFDRQAD